MSYCQVRERSSRTIPKTQKVRSSKLKAKFKDCTPEIKAKFKDSSCILAISVYQDYHEGEELLAAIKLVNESFKKCYIFVDDTLQRHTISLYNRKSDEEIFEDSFIAGTNWIERNKSIYSQLEIPYEIVRWNHWLYHPEFQKNLAFVEQKFNEDGDYRKEFYTSVKEFIRRYKTRSEAIYTDEQHVIDTCIKYVKEECAAMFLWLEKEPNFFLYPGPFNEGIIATNKKFIEPIYPEFLQSVRFRFRPDKNNN